MGVGAQGRVGGTGGIGARAVGANQFAAFVGDREIVFRELKAGQGIDAVRDDSRICPGENLAGGGTPHPGCVVGN